MSFSSTAAYYWYSFPKRNQFYRDPAGKDRGSELSNRSRTYPIASPLSGKMRVLRLISQQTYTYSYLFYERERIIKTSSNLHLFNLKSQGCMITSIWLWNWNKHLTNHPIWMNSKKATACPDHKRTKTNVPLSSTSLVGGLGILVPNSSSSTATLVQNIWTQRNKEQLYQHRSHTHNKIKERENPMLSLAQNVSWHLALDNSIWHKSQVALHVFNGNSIEKIPWMISTKLTS